MVKVNLKDNLDMIKDLVINAQEDLNNVNDLLLSMEEMEEVANLNIEVKELEQGLTIATINVKKIELGFNVYNKTGDIQTFLNVAKPSLEEFNIDMEELLVDLSLGEEDVIASEEGILSAIGKGLKTIFMFLVNIIKGLVDIIVKIITAIINFITGLFSGRSSINGGSSGSPVRSTKQAKKKADKMVKEQFENLKKNLTASNGLSKADELINALLENNTKILIEKTLNHLGIRALFLFLLMADENGYMDYNNLIVNFYDEYSNYINMTKALTDISDFKIGKNRHDDKPVIKFYFDSENTMGKITYFMFDTANTIIKNIKSGTNEEADETLITLISDTVKFGKELNYGIEFMNKRALLRSNNTAQFIYQADETKNGVFSSRQVNELLSDLGKLNPEDWQIFFFKDKIIFNDVLNKTSDNYVETLDKIRKDILNIPFFKVNDVDKTINDLKKLDDVELLTILYASENGLNIDGEKYRSDVVVNLMNYYYAFNKKKLTNTAVIPNNNISDLVNEFNKYIKANDIDKIKILDKESSNFGLSTLLNFNGKLPDWKEVSKDLTETFKDTNNVIVAPNDPKAINIQLLNTILNNILKTGNKEFNLIASILERKKDELKNFVDSLDQFVKSFGNDNYKTKFITLYKNIMNKSKLGTLSDLNEVKVNIEKADNEIKSLEYDNLNNEEKSKLLSKYLKLAILEGIRDTSLNNMRSQFTYLLHLSKLIAATFAEFKNLALLATDEEILTAVTILSGFNKFLEIKKEKKELSSLTKKLEDLEAELLKELKR